MESRGNPNIICNRCGKRGHIKRNCRVKIVCDRCGKLGHIKSNCRVKLKDDNVNANVIHEDRNDDQLNWEKCFSIGVIEKHDNVEHQVDEHSNANVSIDYKKEWIIDSGCTHHATGSASLLSDVRPHDGTQAIVTADNTVHPVKKEGHLNVRAERTNGGSIAFNNVYHVPGLKKNLVSVSQITKSGRYVLYSSCPQVKLMLKRQVRVLVPHSGMLD